MRAQNLLNDARHTRLESCRYTNVIKLGEKDLNFVSITRCYGLI